MRWYPVTALQEDNESWLITCNAFPEIVTFGRNRSKAFEAATQAIQTAINERISKNMDVPLPLTGFAGEQASANLPPLCLIKLSLYRLMREQGVSIAALADKMQMPAERAERLLQIDHNSQIDLLSRALDVVGATITIDVKIR